MSSDLIRQAQAEEQQAEELCLTVREYAKRERLHLITVYRHIKEGKIPVVRHGRAIRIKLRRRITAPIVSRP